MTLSHKYTQATLHIQWQENSRLSEEHRDYLLELLANKNPFTINHLNYTLNTD